MSTLFQYDYFPSCREIVDLARLRPAELLPLFEEERRSWLEELYWDIGPALAIVRRALEQRNLFGRAVKENGRILGYGYYLVEGERALLGGLAVVKGRDEAFYGPELLRSLISAAQREPGVRRVESQFVSFRTRWIRAPFIASGFEEHRRYFCRRPLRARPLPPLPMVLVNGFDGALGPSTRGAPTQRAPLLAEASRGASELIDGVGVFRLEAFRADDVSQAADVLQRAHAGQIDGTINELYRTREGCRILLQNIARERGCGPIVEAASFLARDRATGRHAGLLIATEISPGHAHLAQVAVSPQAQRRGLGRAMLARSIDALTGEGYLTVSLMVSQKNRAALRLYESFGLQTVVEFPVFSWDRPRSYLELQSR